MVAVDDDRFCTACGAPKPTRFCVDCGADARGVDPETRRLAAEPNWGALLLPGVWPIWHGRPWTAAVWWVLLIASVARLLTAGDGLATGGLVVCASIALYLLVRGNRIALVHRRFDDPAAFIATQAAWRGRGLAVAVLYVLAFVGLARAVHR